MSSQRDVAYINSIVTDQGNGGSYCGNCGYDLSKFVLSKDLLMPKRCPGCDKELIWGETHVNLGGSDF